MATAKLTIQQLHIVNVLFLVRVTLVGELPTKEDNNNIIVAFNDCSTVYLCLTEDVKECKENRLKKVNCCSIKGTVRSLLYYITSCNQVTLHHKFT